MKSKYIPILALALSVIVVLCILIFDFKKLDLNLNLTKYHVAEADGKEFIFYGSFGKVRKVTVKENSQKLFSFQFSADADVYADGISAVEIFDVNYDGNNDILVAFKQDSDGDVHRRLLLASKNDYTFVRDVDVINFSDEGGKLISEEQSFKYLAQTREEYTVPYEMTVSKTVYEYFEDTVIPRSKITVSYYSESLIYCVAVFEYDEYYEELISASEDWLSQEEYNNAYETLDEIFSVDLP